MSTSVAVSPDASYGGLCAALALMGVGVASTLIPAGVLIRDDGSLRGVETEEGLRSRRALVPDEASPHGLSSVTDRNAVQGGAGRS